MILQRSENTCVKYLFKLFCCHKYVSCPSLSHFNPESRVSGAKMTPSLAQNIFMPAYITLLFRIINTVKFCVRCKIIANNSSVKSTDFIK